MLLTTALAISTANIAFMSTSSLPSSNTIQIKMLNTNHKEHRPHGQNRDLSVLPRSDSTSEFLPMEQKEVEYFFASDASAVIEHTNRVIYLEVSKQEWTQCPQVR